MTGFAVTIVTAWLLTALLASAGVIDYCRMLRRIAPATDWPAAVVLVAVKGAGVRLSRFLAGLLAQDYPHYRVVFSVESTMDPAFAVLEPLASGQGDRIELIVAGDSVGCAQKVQNLRAALGQLRVSDQVVVFADADIEPAADWLRQLVRPIALGRVVSSGYRWQVPEDCRLPSMVAALADMSIATAGRHRRWNLCWGGSTAIERRLLDRLELPRRWASVATEDLVLTQALREVRVPVYAAVPVLPPSPCSYSWQGLFAFGRRQYLLVRFYAPRHWLLAAWTLCVPAIGAVLAAAAACAGSLAAALCLGAAILLRVLRHGLRLSIARRVLPREIAEAAAPVFGLGWWAWPLVHIVHTAVFVGSLCGREFEWAGIRYRLRRPKDVAILSRLG
jgi:ceramide glucosyltransferase